MNQAPATAFPSVADSPDAGQRTLTALRELVRSFASGMFLLRPATEKIALLRSDEIGVLKWGVLNRLLLMGDAAVQLPRIEPRYIGVPLEFILLDTGNVAELVPTGLGMNRKDRPLINGAASLLKNTQGLYVLKNDGQNWFTAP
jgi:hypothetical protein